MKKTIIRRTIRKSLKKFRSFYSKSPILAIAIIVTVGIVLLGGSSYGVYRLATQTNPAQEPITLDGIEGSTEEPGVEESEDTQEPRAEESTTRSSEPPICSYVGTLENVTTYPMILGGPDGTNIYSSVVIKESSGRPFTPLRLSTGSSMSSYSQSLNLSGLSINEIAPYGSNDISQSTIHRTLQFHQSTSTSSGNQTIYVSDQCGSKPVAVNVSWSPYPKFLSVEETGHSRVVNGDTESYTFSFKITPNAYFGTPELHVKLTGYYTDYCDSESVPSITTTYDGTNTFTLTCRLEVPTCTNPNPVNCEPIFYASVYAFVIPGQYGDGVPGAKSFTYDFSD